MLNKVKYPGGFPLLPVYLFALLLLVSCGSRDQTVGTYVSNASESPRQTETTLELKESGAGMWKVADEEISFSWYVKGKELRVHTKSGGVIVGALDNDVIHITLPGSKQELTFRKVR